MKCLAITKGLTRCKNNTETKRLFCYVHRGWLWRAIIAIITTIGFIVALLAGLSQIFDATLPNPLATPIPTATMTHTPLPPLTQFGDPIFNINFSRHGEGKCNDYDSNLLGYDTSRKLYYIVPETNGYISVCHENEGLPSQGILQTTAFPDADVDYFGYAVFFGWKGGNKTSDACGFGVKKDGSTTKAFFIQIISTNWNHIPVDANISIDTNPHSIRMVLDPSGKATGYLDGKYVAEHSFNVDCASGPVGMIAYGPGDVKINFISLKLFALP